VAEQEISGLLRQDSRWWSERAWGGWGRRLRRWGCGTPTAWHRVSAASCAVRLWSAQTTEMWKTGQTYPDTATKETTPVYTGMMKIKWCYKYFVFITLWIKV